ncbi:MAG: transcription-repair coupling factor [Bacteroidetes bacterium]|nr:transcription-repair coupling factor [Bacteroidota bacterium]
MQPETTHFDSITNRIGKSRFLKEIEQQFTKQSYVSIKTLSGSLRALTVCALWKKSPKRIFILTESKEECQEWIYDLNALVGENNTALFVEPDKRVNFTAEQLDEKIVAIIDSLALVENNNQCIAIGSPECLSFRVPKPNEVHTNRIHLQRNEQLAFNEFITTLSLHGFDRKDFVENQGDMAVRGGIVDVFPLGWSAPLRIEFWGDIIDSIREFDPLSQRSIREHESVDIIADLFQHGDTPFESSIIDYFPTGSLLIVDSLELCERKFEELEISDWKSSFKGWNILSINGLTDSNITVKSQFQPSLAASVHNLLIELRSLAVSDYKIYLATEGTVNSKRLHDLVINGFEQDTNEEPDKPLASPQSTLRKITWMNKTLSKGFVLQDENLAFFTEHQLFERRHFQTNKRGKQFTGITLRELAQLRRGDYVVHIDKGIGRFDGLETITIADSKQDCARVIYEGNDVLFVHLNHIHKLQKYSGGEDAAPKLSKLGSSDWERKKQRSKKKLKDIARELIKLYAERKSQPGFAFPEDTVWQKEFEASFIYEDTPDQSKATSEVKSDMESNTPMDRLVCGDVGFGKTEVAVRAAFKAVQTGKQVAILVPTTILAQQHFSSFKDRLHRYPVTVDVLSRFRSPAEQKVVIENLKKGGVDILIGTHRILSKDIEFKNLGLLVIDEEQKFGVGAKEKLRAMRVTVDTLTLTATPIPRTLNFSLMGARDLSVIETPPRNRLPIITEIAEWNEDTIQKAILREIERGGQIYFVSDKIATLTKIHEQLLELVPTLRCGIAHGQMDTNKLENTMEKFMERKYDVLICTKIVESGLDIPNANTIFIHNADNFGLAELYQLRGRVGRSNTQAYSMLIVPPMRTLSRTALRRLQALEENTDLGSGFQLAMRDMEIRGAGNLLGAEQSGFIAEMGFELYQKIVDEAVNELRSEEFSSLFADETSYLRKRKFTNEDVAVEIGVDALLPTNYVSSDTERFEFYKRLYNVRSEVELSNIISELRDRYGRLPEQAENLIFAVRLRVVSIETGFVRIIFKNKLLIAELPPESNTLYYEHIFIPLTTFISSVPSGRFVQKKDKVFMEAPINSREQCLDFLERFSRHLQTEG